MNDFFLDKIFQAHQCCPKVPSPQQVTSLFSSLLGTMFPDLSDQSFESKKELEFHMLNLKDALYDILYMHPNRESLNAENNTNLFFDRLPRVYDLLKSDCSAMYAGDPAAKSEGEIIRSYPGFYAIAMHRLAHELYDLDVMVIPRMISEHAHARTGIDIHPGASIGNHFCIDHGTGVVIGETAHIGNHVKIYQGVTLGALSVNKADAEVKRHPTIEDHVVIYANATILGGNTIIGKQCIVGGNTWVTQSMAPGTKIYYRGGQNGSIKEEVTVT